ncbi:MAG: hypothetical protein KF749_12050 [Bacteroidetes bacterium]|nr:hypothetical protein [Bacteroidota bacterium]MCW5894237.1 hypothetical protein [Bacteroidota bacterium]
MKTLFALSLFTLAVAAEKVLRTRTTPPVQANGTKGELPYEPKRYDIDDLILQ